MRWGTGRGRLGAWFLAVSLGLASWGNSAVAQEAVETQPAPGPLIELPGEFDPARDPSEQRLERAAPTTVGGYGELVFTDVEDGDNEINFERFVLFVAHRFNDWISFYAELEIEDAEAVEMEQARVDLTVVDELTVVAGLVLVPLGVTNLYHEPPLFHGANRPRVDRVIIPTTWREAGLGLVYRPHEMVTLEAYVLSGLDASGFSAANGIRGGRQSVSEALSNDQAGALRVTIEPVLGLAIGVSGYLGASGQDRFDDESVRVAMGEIDAVYRNHGVEVRAQAAMVFIGDTETLSAALGETIGEQLRGYYLELGYDVLDRVGTGHELVPFVRYEAFDTQASVADGLLASDDLDRTEVTFGLSYRPISALVFKADYQITSSAGAGVPDQWDLGLGWMF